MGITIPNEESELCAQLMRPAWIAAGLTNDLFSWEKECEAARRNGLSYVVNAIWVLKGEHSITTDEAKALCREKIKVAIADYLQVIKRTCNNLKVSLDLRKYIEAMQYSLSGNVVWSLQCPRYHPEAQYNQLQLLRMQYGVAAYPGPNLNITPKRQDDVSPEDTERPRKKAKTRGLPTPSPCSKVSSFSSPNLKEAVHPDHLDTGIDWTAVPLDWHEDVTLQESQNTDTEPLVLPCLLEPRKEVVILS